MIRFQLQYAGQNVAPLFPEEHPGTESCVCDDLNTIQLCAQNASEFDCQEKISVSFDLSTFFDINNEDLGPDNKNEFSPARIPSFTVLLLLLATGIILLGLKAFKKRQERLLSKKLPQLGAYLSEKQLSAKTMTMTGMIRHSSLQSMHLPYNSKREVCESNFSIVLRDLFSKRDFDEFNRMSAGSGTLRSVASYRDSISVKDVATFKKLKLESNNLSTDIIRLDMLLGLSRKKTVKNVVVPAWQIEVTTVVQKVCLRLQDEILTAGEAETLEKRQEVRGLEKLIAQLSDSTERVDLEHYLFRLVTGLNRWFSDDPSIEVVGLRSLLISLIYINKIKQAQPTFSLTVFNVHRLFAVSILTAAKFSEDQVLSNAYWSDISGITLAELNVLEHEFCFASGYNFYIVEEDLSCLYHEFGLQFVQSGVIRKRTTESFISI